MYANEKHVARICHTRRLLLFCLRVLPNQIRLGASGVVRSVLSDEPELYRLFLPPPENGVMRSPRYKKQQKGEFPA